MAKPVKLEDLLPTEPTFSLVQTGKVYSLRIPNIEDDLWIKEKFGDRIQKAWETVDWSVLIHVLYRLLDTETKKQFLAQEIEEIDEEGRGVKLMASGPFILLRAMQPADTQRVVGAMSRAFLLSNPDAEAFVENAVKKNLAMINGLQKLAGQKSSTSSKMNTGFGTKKL